VLNDVGLAEKYNFWLTDYPLKTTIDTAKIAYLNLRLPSEYTRQSSPDLHIISLQQVSSNNSFLLEYVVFYALQHYRHHAFLLENLTEFQQLNYTHLSPYFEQALLVARISDTATNADLFPVSVETHQRYEAYTNDQQRLYQGLIGMKTFENRYKDTYWFHFDFIPQIHDISDENSIVI
jgi:hypothetical protein